MRNDLARAGLKSENVQWSFPEKVRYITDSTIVSDDTLLRMIDLSYITRPVLAFEGKASPIGVPGSRRHFMEVSAGGLKLVRSQNPEGGNSTLALAAGEPYRVQVFECESQFVEEERPFCRLYGDSMMAFYAKAQVLRESIGFLRPAEKAWPVAFPSMLRQPVMSLTEHADPSWYVMDACDGSKSSLQEGKCYRVLIERTKGVAAAVRRAQVLEMFRHPSA